jgi:hypothetical protein
MHISKFENPLTLTEALDFIKNTIKIKFIKNNSVPFVWSAVKTIAGNILEVGGNDIEFSFQLIELDEQKKIVCHSNGFAQFIYAFTCYPQHNEFYLETSSTRNSFSLFKTFDELVNYIENTPNLNHKKIIKTPVYKTVLDYYEIKLDD